MVAISQQAQTFLVPTKTGNIIHFPANPSEVKRFTIIRTVPCKGNIFFDSIQVNTYIVIEQKGDMIPNIYIKEGNKQFGVSYDSPKIKLTRSERMKIVTSLAHELRRFGGFSWSLAMRVAYEKTGSAIIAYNHKETLQKIAAIK